MKFRGGYSIAMAGCPAAEVEVAAMPRRLLLPLRTPTLYFSQLHVTDGQHVARGQVLARDAALHGVPLLAPCSGMVEIEALPGHLVLTSLHRCGIDDRHGLASDEPALAVDEPLHISREYGSSGMLRYKLLSLGAWQYMRDSLSGLVAAPFDVPQAVIVSVLNTEPFVARGDVQLSVDTPLAAKPGGVHHNMLTHFTRGLEHLQSLLEYQPIYLVLPKGSSQLGEQVREAVRGYAFIKTVEIPQKYPLDNFAVLARALGLKLRGQAAVWGLRTEGVLAVDRALTVAQPVDRRLVAIGGPAVLEPRHVSLLPGYPLRELLKGRVDESRGPVRIISGGLLTGRAVGQWPLQGQDSEVGLDSETSGLTLVYEQKEREFLSFMRPGGDRRSYSRCFLSALRRPPPEGLTTGLRGERRACVTCGYCEELCPSGLMPHMIHKLLFQQELEEAARLRLDLCISCGLCSYVCPSKIELAEEFRRAREAFEEEQRAEQELKAGEAAE